MWMLPPLRSMSSLLNPMEQSPIPSPIHVGGSHEHFDTSGGGSSKTKIRLRFSLLGHVVGKNSTKFMSRFGSLVREHIPPYYPDWLAVPLKLKDTVWETICDEYELPQAAKRKLMKSANTMWRNEKKILRKKYDECDTDDERKKNFPKKTKPEDWVRFVDLTSTEEVKASRERNKINRSKMLTPHTTGRKGVFRVADEMMEVDPTITRSDSFLVGHTRSDGTFPTAFVEEKVIAVKDIIMKNPQPKYLDVGHDPLAQVFGPVKKISTPLLREEAVVHFMNFQEHIVATGRALVLSGLQESEEAEYEVIVDIILQSLVNVGFSLTNV
ncbi:hypothetical protein GIB67_040997 [Kingdonia uniflora]|uniref:Uncharacterized protein n=1 Tax=Kingdonia uniflora TaxID=39325 RepID=A0A7J7NC59_9MAGN|nr:hypothetical protein GIB67_040997 [Kingdonia uniflora]